MLWMTNLEDLDALQEAVGLRAYGQRDPLVEYRQEASRLFKVFWGNFNGWVFGNIFKIGAESGAVWCATGDGRRVLRRPQYSCEMYVAAGTGGGTDDRENWPE